MAAVKVFMHPCCYVFSRSGAELGLRLARCLSERPWRSPAGILHGCCGLYAPQKLWSRLGLAAYTPFSDLAQLLGAPAAAHIFVGAMGIAIRSIAPFLRHKSLDPPVVVLDAGGNYAISVLGGHWGGANSLARHLAELCGAQAVITTASDALPNSCALDLLIQDAGLKILDWHILPEIQSRILEGESLPLYDPWRSVPVVNFLNRKTGSCINSSEIRIAAHWKKQKPAPGLLRVAIPVVHIGLGFRRDTPLESLWRNLVDFLDRLGVEKKAVAVLTSVAEKAEVINVLARRLGCQSVFWAAADLSARITPNPSMAAGRFFHTRPFSVCEASALESACRCGRRAFLLSPKIKIAGSMTFAAALAWGVQDG